MIPYLLRVVCTEKCKLKKKLILPELVRNLGVSSTITKYVKFHLKLKVISNTVCKYEPATKLIRHI